MTAAGCCTASSLRQSKKASTSLAAVEQESGRKTWNVQRLLLLSGWSWIATGVGGFIALQMVLNGGSHFPEMPSQGVQYAALIPVGIGIAHLITCRKGERHDSRAE